MRSASRARSGGHKLDFDVNIVPIIDCLTILVIFLLAAGVYVSIGILNVGVTQDSGTSTLSVTPDVEITVEMTRSLDMVLNVTGKMNREIRLPTKNGIWDLRGLSHELEKIQLSWPDVKTATLIADPEISYQDVVKAMEAAKKTHPDVLLGGF